ncbi:cysteine hydrolase family protein [Sporosalibacterium faouarense]|uniref:cysteine hydrolase family protein n=1 Tax=Sporosalibacterium faouarense TaxID=516123 RepID=UPI00192B24FD|nr:isochorismatase family protein [Sporosalibacterium faouarense]
MSIALLIIDMQKEFSEMEQCKIMISSALEYINEVGHLFRKAGNPIIIIQDEEVGDGPGSEGYELMDDLEIMDSDIYLSKIYSNSFWKTDLEKILKNLDVEFVVVSGFAAEHCVLFTYNGALERGFGASILQHGIAGFDKRRVKDTQNIRDVISYQALEYMLTNN